MELLTADSCVDGQLVDPLVVRDFDIGTAATVAIESTATTAAIAAQPAIVGFDEAGNSLTWSLSRLRFLSRP